jgi:phosphoglycerol transferase MdoB-like AlkP superfamily enzyme
VLILKYFAAHFAQIMHRIPRLSRLVIAVALFLFALMFLLRLAVWCFFHQPGEGLGSDFPAFVMGFRFDAREVAILCVLLLLLGSIPFLHPYKTQRGRVVVLTLLFISLLWLVIFYVFDFLHFRYLLQRLNASALGFLEDAKISGSMVWQTYPVLRILLGMIIAVAVLYWLMKKLFSKVAGTPFTGGKAQRIGWSAGIFFVCAFGIFGRIGQYPLRWSDAFNLGSDFKSNLALNPFQSFFSSLNYRKTTYDLSKVKQYYPLVAEQLGVTHPDSTSLNFLRMATAPAGDSGPRPNIVLVICESFSAYKSSMWGNPLNTTPFFNGLCTQGLFFDNCFTPAYGTARGVWATITGIPDVELNKTASRNPLMVDQHSIINDFSGYEKFYFLGGSASWANIRGLLTNNIHGLHLYEQDDYKSPKIDVWGISDKNLFLESNAVLGQQTKPFFAVIQTADNHRPFTIPEEDKKEFKEVNYPLDSLRKYGFDANDELNAFRFTDYCYQKFIEAARKQKYFDNTIFMFIGDHGINGNAGNMFPRAWSDEALTSYHVPLLFYAPKLLQPQRLHSVASQVDVLPTLAGLARVAYRNTTLGHDLVDEYRKDGGRSNVAFIIDPNNADIGVINRSWYYTRNLQSKQEKMVWADFTRPQTDAGKDSLLEVNRKYTTGFYETARYLLMNNKK